ncbi:MAG: permease prefix domain 1-containing protein, partial [Treponema sp.]|nr:permease prefix domain 1-containing protein [Treponema sp.]
MNAKEFVDSLFKGYEETAGLADFKEELLGNLNAKIESLVKKGMDTQAAFIKASAELGD